MTQRTKRRVFQTSEVAKRSAQTIHGIDAGISRKEFDRLFSIESFEWIGWRIEQGEYVSGEGLATAIGANPGTALPRPIRDYLCRFLRGKIKKKRGPKQNVSVGREAFWMIVASAYEEELRRVQAERKAEGRKYRGRIAPNELAAQIIQKHFKLPITPRRLANLLSSRKYRR